MKTFIELRIIFVLFSTELHDYCLSWKTFSVSDGNRFSSTYFSIYTRTAQLVLDNHNNNPKHSHNEGIVADTLSFLKKGFSPAESVADVWFLLAIFIIDTFINATPKSSLLHVPEVEKMTTLNDTIDDASVYHKPGIFWSNTNKRKTGFFVACSVFIVLSIAKATFHRGYRKGRDGLAELQEKYEIE